MTTKDRPEPARPGDADASALAGVRAGYDRWAAIYDHEANPLPALEEPLVRAAVGEVRGRAALNLGCGTGRHAAWLAAAGAKVTALDFSEGMLAEARRRPEGPHIRFVQHDLHTPLPFGDGGVGGGVDAGFDVVVSGLVLEHLRDLEAFFSETARVVRPGGRVVVSAMHPAMFLRGSQARFTDSASGQLVQPGSLAHSLGAMVMAGLRAGLALTGISEHAPDAGFAAAYPRAEKYIGWPMLVVLQWRR